MAERTATEVRNYDLFKLIVTALLAIAILILLIRCSASPRATVPTPGALA